ncbi:hypothetical protein MJ1_0088 [Nanobdella aerobiophila]|uniref:Uncharacterized protein n=1 Tax=Nanobdella aerobiophila TaxID=2586965 RepID=A0A915SJV0_9ARCH|nr:hypothetical protein [Nanobdella aerobiophila]BBL45263.1 hypothetical protein MJ1_0088 [Nanobdella aerobiophila]
MGSFASLLLVIMNNLGLNLIFLFLFYFGLFYFIISYILRLLQKNDTSKININPIAIILSISISYLLTTFSGFIGFTQYFLAFNTSILLLLFFFILMGSLISGGALTDSLSQIVKLQDPKQVQSSNGGRIILITIVVFLIVFGILSMYFGYQNYFLSLSSSNSLQAQQFLSVGNPYILFLLFFFIILGVGIILLGAGGDSKPKGPAK